MKMSKLLTIIILLVAVMSLAACTTKKEDTAPEKGQQEKQLEQKEDASSEGSEQSEGQLDFVGKSETTYGEAAILFRLKADKTYAATLTITQFNKTGPLSEGTWEYADDTFTLTDKEGKEVKTTVNDAGEYVISGTYDAGSLTGVEVNAVATKDEVTAFAPAE